MFSIYDAYVDGSPLNDLENKDISVEEKTKLKQQALGSYADRVEVRIVDGETVENVATKERIRFSGYDTMESSPEAIASIKRSNPFKYEKQREFYANKYGIDINSVTDDHIISEGLAAKQKLVDTLGVEDDGKTYLYTSNPQKSKLAGDDRVVYDTHTSGGVLLTDTFDNPNDNVAFNAKWRREDRIKSGLEEKKARIRAAKGISATGFNEAGDPEVQLDRDGSFRVGSTTGLSRGAANQALASEVAKKNAEHAWGSDPIRQAAARLATGAGRLIDDVVYQPYMERIRHAGDPEGAAKVIKKLRAQQEIDAKRVDRVNDQALDQVIEYTYKTQGLPAAILAGASNIRNYSERIVESIPMMIALAAGPYVSGATMAGMFSTATGDNLREFEKVNGRKANEEEKGIINLWSAISVGSEKLGAEFIFGRIPGAEGIVKKFLFNNEALGFLGKTVISAPAEGAEEVFTEFASEMAVKQDIGKVDDLKLVQAGMAGAFGGPALAGTAGARDLVQAVKNGEVKVPKIPAKVIKQTGAAKPAEPIKVKAGEVSENLVQAVKKEDQEVFVKHIQYSIGVLGRKDATKVHKVQAIKDLIFAMGELEDKASKEWIAKEIKDNGAEIVKGVEEFKKQAEVLKEEGLVLYSGGRDIYSKEELTAIAKSDSVSEEVQKAAGELAGVESIGKTHVGVLEGEKGKFVGMKEYVAKAKEGKLGSKLKGQMTEFVSHLESKASEIKKGIESGGTWYLKKGMGSKLVKELPEGESFGNGKKHGYLRVTSGSSNLLKAVEKDAGVAKNLSVIAVAAQEAKKEVRVSDAEVRLAEQLGDRAIKEFDVDGKGEEEKREGKKETAKEKVSKEPTKPTKPVKVVESKPKLTKKEQAVVDSYKDISDVELGERRSRAGDTLNSLNVELEQDARNRSLRDKRDKAARVLEMIKFVQSYRGKSAEPITKPTKPATSTSTSTRVEPDQATSVKADAGPDVSSMIEPEEADTQGAQFQAQDDTAGPVSTEEDGTIREDREIVIPEEVQAEHLEQADGNEAEKVRLDSEWADAELASREADGTVKGIVLTDWLVRVKDQFVKFTGKAGVSIGNMLERIKSVVERDSILNRLGGQEFTGKSISATAAAMAIEKGEDPKYAQVLGRMFDVLKAEGEKFIPKQSSTYYAPTVNALMVDGKLPDEVYYSMASALLNWVEGDAQGAIHNNDHDIAMRLYGEYERKLTPAEKAFGSTMGSSLRMASGRVGSQVSKVAGLRFKKLSDVEKLTLGDISSQEKLDASLGLMAIELLGETGLVDIVEQKVTEVKGRTGLFNIEDTYGESDLVAEGRPTTHRSIKIKAEDIDTEKSELTGKIGATKSMLRGSDKFFKAVDGVEVNKGKETSEASEVVQRRIPGSLSLLSKKHVEALKKFQSRAWVPVVENIRSFETVDEAGQKILFDMKEEGDVYIADREGVKSRNDGINRNIAALKDFTESGMTKFYLKFKFMNQYRLLIDSNGINPLSSKELHRFTVIPEGMETTFDPSKDSDLHDLFKFSVVQALGNDIDKGNAKDAIEAFDDVYMAFRPMLVAIGAGKSFGEALKEGDNPDLLRGKGAHGIAGVNALLQYFDWFEGDGGKVEGNTITTTLGIEVDGITNGYAIGLMQFASRQGEGLLDDLLRVGIGEKKGDYESGIHGVTDAYRTIAGGVVNAFPGVVAESEGEITQEQVDALDVFIGGSLVDADGVVSGFARKLAKYPFMIFNYGGGMSTISKGIADDVKDKIHAQLASLSTKEEFVELFDAMAQFDDRYAVGAELREVARKSFQNGNLKNTALDLGVVLDGVADTYSPAFASAFEELTGGMTEIKKVLTESMGMVAYAFKEKYEREVRKAEIQLKANGLGRSKLSDAEKRDIASKLVDTHFPKLSGAWFGQTEAEQDSFIDMVGKGKDTTDSDDHTVVNKVIKEATKSVGLAAGNYRKAVAKKSWSKKLNRPTSETHKEKLIKLIGEGNGGKSSKELDAFLAKPSDTSFKDLMDSVKGGVIGSSQTTIAPFNFSEPGAKFLVRVVQNIDASIAVQNLLDNEGSLSLHDAVYSGLSDIRKSAKGLNDRMYDINTDPELSVANNVKKLFDEVMGNVREEARPIYAMLRDSDVEGEASPRILEEAAVKLEAAVEGYLQQKYIAAKVTKEIRKQQEMLKGLEERAARLAPGRAEKRKQVRGWINELKGKMSDNATTLISARKGMDRYAESAEAQAAQWDMSIEALVQKYNETTPDGVSVGAVEEMYNSGQGIDPMTAAELRKNQSFEGRYNTGKYAQRITIAGKSEQLNGVVAQNNRVRAWMTERIGKDGVSQYYLPEVAEVAKVDAKAEPKTDGVKLAKLVKGKRAWYTLPGVDGEYRVIPGTDGYVSKDGVIAKPTEDGNYSLHQSGYKTWQSVVKHKDVLYSLGETREDMQRDLELRDRIENTTVENLDEVNEELKGLDGEAETNEHRDRLDGLLGGLINPLMGVIDALTLTLNKSDKIANGWFKRSSNHITVNYSDKGPKTYSEQSRQEVYLHELVHAVGSKLMDSVPRFREKVGRIQSAVHQDLGRQFGAGKEWRAFIEKGMGDLIDPREEVRRAKEQYQAAFGMGSVQEFLAYGLSNRAMASTLSKMAPQKRQWAKGDTWYEKLANVLVEAAEWLMDKMDGKEPSANLYMQLLDLTQAVTGVTNSKTGEIAKKVGKYTNTDSLDNFIQKHAAELPKKFAGKMARLGVNATGATKGMGSIARWTHINAQVLDLIFNDLDGKGRSWEQKVAQAKKLLDIPGEIRIAIDSKIVNYMYTQWVGMTKKTPMYLSRGVTQSNHDNEQARTQEKERIIRQVKDSFNAGQPSLRERKALTQVLGRTEFYVLVDELGIDRAIGLVTDQNKVGGKLDSFLAKKMRDGKVVPGTALYHQMMGLSSRRMFGRTKRGLVGNNAQVAYEKAPVGERNNIGLKDFKVLVALASLKKADSQAKKLVADVAKREMGTGKEEWNGITGVVTLLKSGAMRSEEAFVGQERLMQDGYMSQITDPHKDIVTAESDAATRELMEKKGYQFVNVHADNPSTALYYAKNLPIDTQTKGLFSTTSKKRAGSSLLAAFMDEQGPVEDNKEYSRIKREYLRELVRAERSKGSSKVEGAEYALRPIYNAKGKLVDFTHDMGLSDKNRFLSLNTDIFDVLGQNYGSVTDKLGTEKINKRGVDSLVDRYKEHYEGNEHEFVDIMSAEIIDETFLRLPYEARQKILGLAKGSDGRFMVEGAYLDAMFGYRNWSISELGFIKNEKSKRIIRIVEEAVNGIVGVVNNNIIIKTPVVPLFNFASNFTTSVISGMSPLQVVKHWREGLRELRVIQADMEALAQFDNRARVDTAWGNKHQQQRDKLVRRINANPTKELVDAGLYSAITTEGMHADEFSYKNQFVKKINQGIEEKFGKKGQFLTSIVKGAYLAEDTSAYKSMLAVVQVSDFLGRYGVYKDMVEKKGKSKDEAFQYIQDVYVDFNVPVGKFHQYANSMGMIMFYKYFVKIQRPIFGMIKHHPTRSMATLGMRALTGLGIPSIFQSGIVTGGNFAPMLGWFDPIRMIKEFAIPSGLELGIDLASPIGMAGAAYTGGAAYDGWKKDRDKTK